MFVISFTNAAHFLPTRDNALLFEDHLTCSAKTAGGAKETSTLNSAYLAFKKVYSKIYIYIFNSLLMNKNLDFV